MIRLRRFLPPIASGLLYGLSFPPYGQSYLAWFALAPLFWSIASQPGRAGRAFAAGFASLLTSYLLIFSWLWPTFDAAGINPVTTFGCWVALASILALYGGGVAVFHSMIPAPWARPWLTAAAWVALDELRTVALTGFPWALAGHTQARATSFVQIASVTGAGGVTFLIVLASASLAEAALMKDRAGRRRRQSVASCAAAVGLVVLSAAFGYLRLLRSSSAGDRRVRVCLLQGNIDQYRKWDDAYEADIRSTYSRLVIDGVVPGEIPDVFIWPETAVPGWVPKDPFYTQWISGIARSTGRWHIFGTLSGDEEGEYNAAILAAPDGRLVARYDKMHLVPFGEYLPFGGFLKGLIPYLGQVGTFDRGEAPASFDAGGIIFAPNICYEAIFPGLVRRSAAGADVIVNVTNDGWFLASGAPEQHFVANVFRAVENARPLVRAANTGISAIIDSRGRILQESPLLKAGAFCGTLSLPDVPESTIFSRAGNWFGAACTATALVGLAFILRRKYSPPT